MSKTAVVLQGGAVRGNFTAGVLDVFLKNNIEFDMVIGVSAGSLCACNYLSKQIGRSERINTVYCDDKRFMSTRNLVFHGNYINFKWLFGKCATTTLPFDYQTFNENKTRFIIVASSLKDGAPTYFEKNEIDNVFKACASSSSIPLISRPIKIGKIKYLDGGATDSIPFMKAIDEGYDKIVVVTTQNRSFRKTKEDMKWTKKFMLNFRYFFHRAYLKKTIDYPRFYNEQVEKLYQYEKEGRLFVISPKESINISRIEKNDEVRESLYHFGFNETEEILPSLLEYLGR